MKLPLLQGPDAEQFNIGVGTGQGLMRDSHRFQVLRRVNEQLRRGLGLAGIAVVLGPGFAQFRHCRLARLQDKGAAGSRTIRGTCSSRTDLLPCRVEVGNPRVAGCRSAGSS